jgi:hypothetical protein
MTAVRKPLVAMVAVAALVAGGATAAPASAKPTHVVCVDNDWSHWHTAVHPGNCSLHVRRDCWCHAGLVLFRSAHWLRWDDRRARGKGKESFNGGVTAKERVDLFRPRWGLDAVDGVGSVLLAGDDPNQIRKGDDQGCTPGGRPGRALAPSDRLADRYRLYS